MPQLVYMKGLPGSGKTTLARTKYPNHYRVNKDDIRAMLYGDAKFTREREQAVVAAERQIVNTLTAMSHNVVVDNTGFNKAHEDAYLELATSSTRKGYSFIIEDLSSVPLHECLQRNALRTGKARVPDKVIYDMWRKYVQPKLAYAQNLALPPCIIVDIDGTIAQMDGRGPFEWDKVGTDRPRKEVIAAIEAYNILTGSCPKIIFLSGRDSCCERLTKDWLCVNTIYPSQCELYMRPAGDSRPDYVVKRELWEKHIKDKYRVVAVFDDRPSVLRLWRELGFTTFDVGPGVEF